MMMSSRDPECQSLRPPASLVSLQKQPKECHEDYRDPKILKNVSPSANIENKSNSIILLTPKSLFSFLTDGTRLTYVVIVRHNTSKYNRTFFKETVHLFSSESFVQLFDFWVQKVLVAFKLLLLSNEDSNLFANQHFATCFHHKWTKTS